MVKYIYIYIYMQLNDYTQDNLLKNLVNNISEINEFLDLDISFLFDISSEKATGGYHNDNFYIDTDLFSSYKDWSYTHNFLINESFKIKSNDILLNNPYFVIQKGKVVEAGAEYLYPVNNYTQQKFNQKLDIEIVWENLGGLGDNEFRGESGSSYRIETKNVFDYYSIAFTFDSSRNIKNDEGKIAFFVDKEDYLLKYRFGFTDNEKFNPINIFNYLNDKKDSQTVFLSKNIFYEKGTLGISFQKLDNINTTDFALGFNLSESKELVFGRNKKKYKRYKTNRIFNKK